MSHPGKFSVYPIYQFWEKRAEREHILFLQIPSVLEVPERGAAQSQGQNDLNKVEEELLLTPT